MDTGGISIWQLVVLVGIFVLIFWPWYRIYAKAGYSGWLALLMFVPLLNIVMLFFLAFSDWPALRERFGSKADA